MNSVQVSPKNIRTIIFDIKPPARDLPTTRIYVECDVASDVEARRAVQRQFKVILGELTDFLGGLPKQVMLRNTSPL